VGVSESLGLLLALLRGAALDRSDGVAENLLLRHQLAVLTRPTRRRPRLRAGDKLLWVLARRLRRDRRRHLVVGRPETVVRWHRHAWRLFWRWRSRSRLGRPRLSPEVRELIARLAGDNPWWGSERLRGGCASRGSRPRVSATTVGAGERVGFLIPGSPRPHRFNNSGGAPGSSPAAAGVRPGAQGRRRSAIGAGLPPSAGLALTHVGPE
jgi:hypothetical protein